MGGYNGWKDTRKEMRESSAELVSWKPNFGVGGARLFREWGRPSKDTSRGKPSELAQNYELTIYIHNYY